MAVQSGEVLAVATQVLIESPGASLGDIARAAGISRTTLHTWFPTRQELLIALAMAAMDLIEEAYVEAELEVGPVEDAIRRAVALMIPLGPRVEFLLRERSLDAEAEVVARHQRLDRPMEDLVRRGQDRGTLRRDLPGWWIVSSLASAVFGAWNAVADGRLAPRDASDIVCATVLDGLIPR